MYDQRSDPSLPDRARNEGVPRPAQTSAAVAVAVQIRAGGLDDRAGGCSLLPDRDSLGEPVDRVAFGVPSLQPPARNPRQAGRLFRRDATGLCRRTTR